MRAGRGPAILTDQPAGQSYGPPVIWEPPWPLVTAHELWIAAAGPPTWGGGEVLVSEDDDDYDWAGSLSSGVIMGTLLSVIPSMPPESLGRLDNPEVRVEFYGERALPSASPATAARLGAALLVGDEVIGYAATELERATERGQVYRLGRLLVRGGYGTGRDEDGGYAAHLPGEPVVRLDRRVFRYAYPARLVGQRLWIKVVAKNPMGDPDGTDDPTDAEPTEVVLRGAVEERPAWRSIR